MNATDVMKKAEKINQEFKDKGWHLPPHSYLADCGWMQIDGSGLFFISPSNKNGYVVDMCKCNYPHVSFSHNNQRMSSIDGIPEPDLAYLNGMLEEVEIWLVL